MFKVKAKLIELGYLQRQTLVTLSPRPQRLAFSFLRYTGEYHHGLHTTVIKCWVPKNKNKEIEKLSAIRILQAASKDIEEKHFGSQIPPAYSYVNQEGDTLLDTLDQLGAEIKKTNQESKQTNQESKQTMEELKQIKEESKQIKEELKHWILMMKPLEGAAVAIRGRVYNKYCEMKRKAPHIDSIGNTLDGNIIAHDGNILTDAHMFACGDLTDTSTFEELYGIPHTTVKRYSGMCPNLIVIIIFTKRLQSQQD